MGTLLGPGLREDSLRCLSKLRITERAKKLLRNTAARPERQPAACGGVEAKVGMAARNPRREKGVRGGRNRPGVTGPEETRRRSRYTPTADVKICHALLCWNT